jgi:hypothetical protein
MSKRDRVLELQAESESPLRIVHKAEKRRWTLDNLIIELERTDQRLLVLTGRKAVLGVVSEDELQALKYQRCLVLNKIFEIINGKEELYGQE